MKMKHPEFDTLLDLAEGKKSASNTRDLKAHVQGCEQCREAVEWAKNSFRLMHADQMVDAPEHVIQKGLAAFQPKKASIAEWILAKMEFDSWQLPTMAGVRTTEKGPRQCIYLTDHYKVILMLNRDSVIGQLIPLTTNARPDSCLVEMASGKKVVARQRTNKNGEFVLDRAAKKQMALTIHGDPDSIRISLP